MSQASRGYLAAIKYEEKNTGEITDVDTVDMFYSNASWGNKNRSVSTLITRLSTSEHSAPLTSQNTTPIQNNEMHYDTRDSHCDIISVIVSAKSSIHYSQFSH